MPYRPRPEDQGGKAEKAPAAEKSEKKEAPKKKGGKKKG